MQNPYGWTWMKLALGSFNGFNQLQQSLGISMISGRNAKSHQHDICTKDNDHAKDEKFRGCGPNHLEQFTSHSANCNSLPWRSLDIWRPTCLADRQRVWDYLWRALQIHSSSSSSTSCCAAHENNVGNLQNNLLSYKSHKSAYSSLMGMTIKSLENKSTCLVQRLTCEWRLCFKLMHITIIMLQHQSLQTTCNCQQKINTFTKL